MGQEFLECCHNVGSIPTTPLLSSSLYSILQAQNQGNDLLQVLTDNCTDKEKDTNLFFTRSDGNSNLEESESYLDLAVDVLLSGDPDLIQSLKNFLTILSSPVSIETILLNAIYRIAEGEPKKGSWLLHHADYFLPELDLWGWVRELVCTRLEEEGFILSKHFRFEANSELLLAEAIAMGLFAEETQPDPLLRILIAEYLESSQS
ncbi:hypothetical protein [Spirulina sp. 06S082]|uniref:hypothetical protein n=1 Tax=Spirulina sp. 06S082 TaxID=3110248 RepID=UPI002B1F938B|nr:hypothetical protein [Spirulina sp. 06S082]MEA5468240.1 hypothetical protein [Spirulina sp. 06S082]